MAMNCLQASPHIGAPTAPVKWKQKIMIAYQPHPQVHDLRVRHIHICGDAVNSISIDVVTSIASLLQNLMFKTNKCAFVMVLECFWKCLTSCIHMNFL